MNGQRAIRTILLADLAWLPIALLASYLLRYGFQGLDRGLSQAAPGSFFLLSMVMMSAWVLLFEPLKLDCFRSGWNLSAMASKALTAILLQMGIAVSWGYVTRLYYSRFVLACFMILFWIGTTLIRLSVLGLLRKWRREGRAIRIMIIGDGNVQKELVARIHLHPELMYEVVGHLHPLKSSASSGTSPDLTTLAVLDLLKNLRVREIFVVFQQAPGIELQNFLLRCRAEGIMVNVLPQRYELYVSRLRLVEIDGMPFINLEEPTIFPLGVAVKRFMDLVLGIALLLPGTAIALFAGGTLWLSERRFLRREVRCGQDGKPFGMFRLDIETDLSKASPLERVLRRLSFSELPQLWNVVLGEMSLVGPRPESPERVRHYTEWQRQRLRYKPGMTGLAQVNGLREQHSSEEKARYDLQYMLNWSPLLDLVLLLQTLWTLGGRMFSARAAQSALLLETREAQPEKRVMEVPSSGVD